MTPDAPDFVFNATLIYFGMFLCVHFLADFVLQSRQMAKQKSEDLRVLLQHVGVHWIAFFVFLIPAGKYITWVIPLTAATTIALVHAVIDWNVWRGYKRRSKKLAAEGSVLWRNEEWRYWDDHDFWLTLGIDQLLHGLTLVLVIWLLPQAAYWLR